MKIKFSIRTFPLIGEWVNFKSDVAFLNGKRPLVQVHEILGSKFNYRQGRYVSSFYDINRIERVEDPDDTKKWVKIGYIKLN